MGFKKSIATICALIMMFSFCAATASAAEVDATTPAVARADYWMSRSYSGSFDSAWQLSATEGNASLTYGYNTWMVNEDYAWANHSELYHWAEVKNDNGSHRGVIRGPGTVSKKEVTHSGSRVTYYCNWG